MRKNMGSVTVSTRFRVTIPLEIRKRLGIKLGQKLQVIGYENQVIFIPARPVKEARGSLKSIDTRVLRDDEENRPTDQA
jgi:AbrB family looped-hinge helix DNA binding protein